MKRSLGSLATAICDESGSKSDRAMGGCYSAMAAYLRKSERFVFSDECMHAAWDVSQGKPSSLLSALDMVRAPFKETWLEWNGGSYGVGERGNKYGTPVPERVGAHIQALDDDMRRIGITFAWRHAGKPISICPVGIVANWHDKWRLGAIKYASESDDQFRRRAKSLVPARRAKWLDSDEELKALRELSERQTPAINPYMKEYFEAAERRGSQAQVRSMFDQAMRDIEGEGSVVFALLCLMNSRNCVETAVGDQRAERQSRRARGKKPPLSYSTVTINLSRRDQRIAEGVGATPAEIREHIVRGHFKVRRTGVFWWRPFFRGDAEIGRVERTGYRVVDRPPPGEERRAG